MIRSHLDRLQTGNVLLLLCYPSWCPHWCSQSTVSRKIATSVYHLSKDNQSLVFNILLLETFRYLTFHSIGNNFMSGWIALEWLWYLVVFIDVKSLHATNPRPMSPAPEEIPLHYFLPKIPQISALFCACQLLLLVEHFPKNTRKNGLTQPASNADWNCCQTGISYWKLTKKRKSTAPCSPRRTASQA